jgi:hypothetical protein
MNYSLYYQAHVVPQTAWYLTAVMRSFEHLAFDRTIDVKNSIFEFFVPSDLELYFLEIMNSLQAEGYIQNLQKLSNRLENSSESA